MSVCWLVGRSVGSQYAFSQLMKLIELRKLWIELCNDADEDDDEEDDDDEKEEEDDIFQSIIFSIFSNFLDKNLFFDWSSKN